MPWRRDVGAGVVFSEGGVEVIPGRGSGQARGGRGVCRAAAAPGRIPRLSLAGPGSLLLPVKQTVRKLVGTPLGWRLARATVRSPGAIVLMYHRVGPAHGAFKSVGLADFRRQMAWLRRHCRPIAPEALEASARQPDKMRPPVLVTFDDGYRDYHDHAWPVLHELGIPALVFLSTAFMDGGGLLWSEALRWALAHTRRERAGRPGGGTMPLRAPADRRAWLAEWAAVLRRLPEAEKRAAVAALLEELAQGDPPAPPPRQMLSWDEVRKTRGLTTFGGHTHTHPILSRVAPAQLDEELRTCRERIEAETGQRPRFFAYPNGQREDFTPAVKEAVRGHGFEVAFSAIEGVNGPHTDWLEVRRFSGRSAAPQMAWLANAAS
jgi:peptidoglycan/xylan/chitin deacetylase (PgdA/CDA1 family)